ncbi:hypothetical protein SAMN05216188_11832 [Lentzea xinjiangensis]|uniref:Uncharacterized protein n=1 Tax=Lentzea xinjiangensis TaxID=402600 RepID=A0A1H9TCF5_9PSEU|nr:hypothetical protein SAMN05216188_11832 [Lentzea xinjiangensis]
MNQADDAVANCKLNQERIFPASRVLFCDRCGHATGGEYGHFSGWCKQAGGFKSPHFCCPASCELQDGVEMSANAPCHPASEDIARWAIARDEER